MSPGVNQYLRAIRLPAYVSSSDTKGSSAAERMDATESATTFCGTAYSCDSFIPSNPTATFLNYPKDQWSSK